MADPVEWTEHPTLATLLARCWVGRVPLGTSSSQMVTVAMPGPILPPVGMAMAFVPHSVGDAGVPVENSPLSPAVLEGSPLVEGTLVSYRLSEGPLEWPSCDEGGDTRFVLNASREDKVWRHVGRQGLDRFSADGLSSGVD